MATSKAQYLQDVEWAIGVNYLSLKMCGLWRNENNSRCHNASLNLLVPLYLLLIMIISSFPQALALLKVWGNLTLMAENLLVSVPTVTTVFSMSIMWFKKKVIITMMIFIRDDWSKMKSEEERQVMIKYAQASRMITIGGFLTISSSFLTYNLPILFGIIPRTINNITDTGSRPLVIQSVYIYDVYETPMYEFTMISQVVCFILVCFFYTIVGTIFGAIVLHVCSQFENLAHRIERMLKNETKLRDNFQKMFSSNVKEHQRLIRFVAMIDNTFSIMLLMIIPSFTIMFCVQGLTLIDVVTSNVRGPIVQIAFAIIYISFITFIMFIYSLVGQILETKSEEIQYAAYNCNWYELQPKQVAMLILILIRAQRPLQITAGKLVPLSMNTFVTLLKTTSGYLSCLLAVHE